MDIMYPDTGFKDKNGVSLCHHDKVYIEGKGIEYVLFGRLRGGGKFGWCFGDDMPHRWIKHDYEHLYEKMIIL